MSSQRIFRISPSLGYVATVSSEIDHFNPVASDGFFQALKPFDSVLHVLYTYEDHDFSAVRKRFDDEFSALATSFDIVRAKIAHTIAIGRIAIDANQSGVIRPFVDHANLVLCTSRANGDALGSGDQQVIHDLLLFGCRSIAGAEEHFDVSKFTLCCPGTRFCISPKIGGNIGDK